MKRLKSIVVGVDFSACSRNALAQALRMADYNGARLHVVHVIQPSLSTDIAEAYAVSTVDRWDDLRRMTQERMESTVAVVRKANPPAKGATRRAAGIEVEVVFGNQFVHLLRCVRDFDAEMLVLGSNSSSNPADGPGRLARKCLHKAPVRVMLVSRGGDRPFECISACVGFSEKCRGVVVEAIHLARQEAARLHVLHLCEAQRVAVAAGGLADTEEPDSFEMRDRTARELKSFLPPFAAEMEGMEINVQMSQGGFDKAAELIRHIQAVQSDLVVLGTRGSAELKEPVEESAAETILRLSGCSILAVKPQMFRYEVGGACRRR